MNFTIFKLIIVFATAPGMNTTAQYSMEHVTMESCKNQYEIIMEQYLVDETAARIRTWGCMPSKLPTRA